MEPPRGGASGGMGPHLCRRPGPSLSGNDDACPVSLIISLTGPWWAGGFALVSAGDVGWLEPLSAALGAVERSLPTPHPVLFWRE